MLRCGQDRIAALPPLHSLVRTVSYQRYALRAPRMHARTRQRPCECPCDYVRQRLAQVYSLQAHHEFQAAGVRSDHASVPRYARGGNERAETILPCAR